MSGVKNFVIVPTYNEADNLEDLLSQIIDLPVSVGVFVVDDNSPDGTGDLADSWSERYPDQVFAIHRPAKLGLGTAYVSGFRNVLAKTKAENILTMDADFSHHPRYIPDMLTCANDRQVVIGSRYVPGGGSRNCTWKRIALSKGANWFARLALGLEAHDVTAGFRLYKREVLESIPLDQIFSSGYSFLVEMLFLCQQRGWQIGEVPIIFEDRRKGKTKISRQEIFKAQYTVLRLLARRLAGVQPRQSAVSSSN